MEFLQEWGYTGLFIGSFLASTVVPFSADFLIIGLLLAGGNPFLCFISATAGNWLGGITSFGIGWLGKWEWIERFFKVKRETLARQKERIDKYGALLAFMSWLPFVGDIFAIGLGFYKLPPVKCSVYMLIGKGARFLLWIGLFLLLGDKLPWL
jgi:membrane protein YqaA with SNARE-associated domain